MYLFIAIIFTAELIIAGALIRLLVNWDKKAKDFTTQWIKTETDSIRLIKEFRHILKSAQDIMENTVIYVRKKSKEIKQKLINLTLIYVMLTVLQYFILAKDVWNSIPI